MIQLIITSIFKNCHYFLHTHLRKKVHMLILSFLSLYDQHNFFISLNQVEVILHKFFNFGKNAALLRHFIFIVSTNSFLRSKLKLHRRFYLLEWRGMMRTGFAVAVPWAQRPWPNQFSRQGVRNLEIFFRPGRFLRLDFLTIHQD